jgi:hypothetical protein
LKDIGILIDIGGGNGLVTNVFLDGKNTAHTINVDLFAMPSHYDTVISEDITRSALRDDVADAAISICVLEHIPEALSLFKDIYAKIKKGSFFLFTTPKVDYYESLVLYNLFKIFSRVKAEEHAAFDIRHSHHCSLYDEEQMTNALRKAGFSEVRAHPFYAKEEFFVYDLLNLSAKLPSSWHFWGGLQNYTIKYKWVKSFFKRILGKILLGIRNSTRGKRYNKYTHALYVCRK